MYNSLDASIYFFRAIFEFDWRNIDKNSKRMGNKKLPVLLLIIKGCNKEKDKF